jgi:hypothetical protein
MVLASFFEIKRMVKIVEKSHDDKYFDTREYLKHEFIGLEKKPTH